MKLQKCLKMFNAANSEVLMHKSVLPSFLQDKSNLAIEKCIIKAFEIDLKPFMTAIVDKLPDKILTAKAEAMSLTNGDGWQNCDTRTKKCKAIKKSVAMHRLKGTVKGIKSLLNSNITYLQWNEYGGIPYHYKLIFKNEKYTKTDINKILMETQNVKRLSAKMDGYEAVISSKTPLNIACREKIDITIKCLPKGE